MIIVRTPKQRKWFPELTKADLLDIMFAACPQQIWPPRPTQQSADTIREIVRSATYNGYHGARVRTAVAARLRTKRGEG